MRRFVLGLAIAATAIMPAAANADDQQIAEFIKSRLQAEQQAGNLRGFNLDLKVEQGTVWFTGYVANEQQEELVLQTAQQAGRLGAVKIVDDIEIRRSVMQPSEAAQQVDYQESAAGQVPQIAAIGQSPMPTSTQPVQPQSVQPQSVQAQPVQPQSVQAQPVQPQSVQPQPVQAQPIPMQAQPMPMQGGMNLDQAYGQPQGMPVPAYQASSSGQMPMPMGYTSDNGGMGGAPSLPGYAWPAYAAAPNYAAVNYPKQYSPSAWPYIGPFYPYPQVPMGWRRVELEWDDGWWFLDFHDR